MRRTSLPTSRTRTPVRSLPTLVLVAVLACRPGPAPGPATDTRGGNGGPEAGAATGSAASDDASTAPPGPPEAERTCTRDDECAVARVAVSGKETCCWSCRTTAGTRPWHAKLQRYCGTHPPANCGALACPEGPTRAICRSGRCEATYEGPDGGPTRVSVEQRCLPAMICDSWAGCAFVSGNAQDGWFVSDAEQLAGGAAVSLKKNACTVGPPCEAAWAPPERGVCPPWTAPPYIPAPTYRCVAEGSRCVSRAK
jgi:hypothetical protein